MRLKGLNLKIMKNDTSIKLFGRFFNDLTKWEKSDVYRELKRKGFWVNLSKSKFRFHR